MVSAPARVAYASTTSASAASRRDIDDSVDVGAAGDERAGGVDRLRMAGVALVEGGLRRVRRVVGRNAVARTARDRAHVAGPAHVLAAVAVDVLARARFVARRAALRSQPDDHRA